MGRQTFFLGLALGLFSFLFLLLPKRFFSLLPFFEFLQILLETVFQFKWSWSKDVHDLNERQSFLIKKFFCQSKNKNETNLVNKIIIKHNVL